MIDFSFLEKLGQLKDIILSSPLFFISVIVGIVLLVIMIIGIKKNRRINKIVFIITWIFVVLFYVIKYFKYFISIFDRLFGRIVDEIYFPSMSIYTIVLIITNITFVYSLFKSKINNLLKIINISFSMLIDFLFILILDTIMNNNIDISAKFGIYTNSNLLILLELSMIIILIWILVVIVISLINKYAVKKVFINKYKETDYEVIDTQIKEEITDVLDIDNNIEILDNNELETLDFDDVDKKDKVDIFDL